MSRRHILFLILLATILGIWRFLETPSFADTLLNFITAGEVPITHYVMTPDDTIRLAIGLFVVTIFVVFRKEFMAAMPKRHKPAPMRQHPVSTPATVRRSVAATTVVAQPRHEARSPIVITLPRHNREWWQQARIRTMNVLLAFAARLAYCLLVVTDGTKYLWTKVKTYMQPKLLWLGRASRRYTRSSVRWTVKMSRNLWYRALPHLKAADRQIEKMLRQNKKTATFTLLFDEGTKMGMRALRRQNRRIRKAGKIVTARVFKG